MILIYETGLEEPEILGSGSNYKNVTYRRSFEEIMELYKPPLRNYLIRYTYSDDPNVPHKTEVWNDETKTFE